jgi:hypothetical protein
VAGRYIQGFLMVNFQTLLFSTQLYQQQEQNQLNLYITTEHRLTLALIVVYKAGGN